MEPAARKLSEVLDSLTYSEMKAPVVTNCNASLNNDSAVTKELLVKQVVSPVRWYESVQVLAGNGVSGFYEIGPKNVLAGLIKRTLDNATVTNFEKTADLESIKNGRK